MSLMRLIILAVAAGAAIAAALLVRNLSASSGQGEPIIVEKEVEVASAKVLVTTRDLVVGELLTPEDLSWADWPSSHMNLEFFTEELQPTAIEDVAGSVVRTPFYENEPILPQKIVQKGETGYMAALLTPGMRAASVQISAESASGGFILPNDRVDVLFSYTEEDPNGGYEGEEGEPETVESVVTILENVRVLAIDQAFRTTDTGESVVGRVATLELSPSDAELITLADGTGELTLALRSLGDALASGDAVVSRRDLFLDDGGPAAGEVVIYRNGEPSISKVGGTGS